MAQRRGGVQRREHFGAGGFHVAFQAFDAVVRVTVFDFNLFEGPSGGLLFLFGARCRVAAFGHRGPARLAPRVERAKLGSHLERAMLDGIDLLAVEFNMLLAPRDVELAGVHRFARSRRVLVGADERHAHAAEIRIGGGDGGSGTRFAHARVGQSRAN